MAKSSSEIVVREVLNRIHNHVYTSESIISEAELCESLKVSRTPVREALIKLCAGGLLDKVPRKGYKLREFDVKTKLDTYHVIALLDAEAARLSISHLTEKDFLKLNELVDLMEIDLKYKNQDNYNHHQELFHLVYINKSNNIPLQNTLQSIKDSVPSYLYHSDDTETLSELLEKVNDEHRHIIKLLKEKKEEELIQFLREEHWSTDDLSMI